MLNLIRRAVAYVNIRLLEIDLHDKQLCLPLVLDPLARHGLEESMRITRKQLTAARIAYTATFPPGIRFLWRLA